MDVPGSGSPGPGFPGSFGGDFLQQMLQDLLQLMGKAAPVGDGNLALARSLAQAVATGGEAEGNVEPALRIEAEELARIAEMHVADMTGGPLVSGGKEIEIVCVGPGAWAWHTVGDWAYLAAAMAPVVAGAGAAPGRGGPVGPGEASGAGEGDTGEAIGGGPVGGMSVGGGPVGGSEDFGRDLPPLGLEQAGWLPDEAAGPDAPGSLDAILSQWLSMLGPLLGSLQLGSAVGHLARSALGHYEVPLARLDTTRLMVVPSACDRFAREWSLSREQVVLWVFLRDFAMQRALGRPHVAKRLMTLVTGIVEGSVARAANLAEQLGDVDPSDLSSLQRLMEDPELFTLPEPSAKQRRLMDDLSALTAVILGYVDHVIDTAGSRLVGNRSAIAEAWRRRDVEGESSARSVESLVGLDTSLAQVERGQAFVRGVIERAGEAALSLLWDRERNLPTPAEVEAPGLWLERIALDDPAP